MKTNTRTLAGRLNSNRANARETATAELLSVQKIDCLYDFTQDAGAVGDVTFGAYLPAGAIVTAVIADVLTAVTSAGSATVALKAGSTALTGATAKASLAAGCGTIALASSATAIKPSATAATELAITIATAALTAGKIRFTVLFVVPK